MGRWEPDAPGRLRQAALELFAERGFEQATVTDIARRAGLTQRTFFRHFADKREVLFHGSAALEELFVAAIAAAPAGAAPIDAVGAALESAATRFAGFGEGSRVRARIIAANAELRERELIKLASLAAAVAGALRARGVRDPAAGLAAEAGIAVFRVGFDRWVDGPGGPDLRECLREAMDELKAVTAGR